MFFRTKRKKKQLVRGIKILLGLLIFLYIFRTHIISPVFCRALSEIADKTAGIQLHIGSLGGNYFQNIKIEDIHLLDKKNKLELRLAKITVHYRPSAIISGNRIVRKIEILEPEITITPGEKQEPQPEEQGAISFSGLQTLLRQVPDLDIVGAKFTLRLAKGLMQAGPIDIHSKTGNDAGKVMLDGNLSWSKTSFEKWQLPPIAIQWGLACASDKAIFIENLDIQWGKNVTRLEGKIALDSSEQTNLVMETKISSLQKNILDLLALKLDLDCSIKTKLKIKGNLPLGTALDISPEFQVQLTNIAWKNQSLPDLELVGFCELDDKILTINDISLLFDQKQIWSIGGKVGYVSGIPTQLQTKLLLPCRKILSDLKPITGDLPLEGILRLSSEIKGFLPIDQPLSLSHSFQLEFQKGKWQKMALVPVTLSGKMSIDDKEIKIPGINLSLGVREIWKLEGQAGYVPGGNIDILSVLQFEQIADLLKDSIETEEHLPEISVNGDALAIVKIQGKLPVDQSISLVGDIRFSLNNLLWQSKKLPKIDFHALCKVRNETIDIPGMELKIDGKQIWQMEAAVDYVSRIIKKLEMKVDIDDIAGLLEPVLGKQEFKGSIASALSLQGSLDPMAFEGNFHLSVSDAQYQEREYPPIRFSGLFGLDGEKLSIPKIVLELDREKIANVQGWIGLDRKLKIETQLMLKNIREKMALVLPREQIPEINSNLKVNIAVEGELPQDNGNGVIEINTRISVTELIFLGKKLPKIQFDNSCRLQKEKVIIPHCSLFMGAEKIWDLQGELLQNHKIKMKMQLMVKDIRQKMALVLEQDQIPDVNGNVKLQVAVEGELPQADGEMDLKVKTKGELAKLSLIDKKLPTIKWKGRCRAQKQKVIIPQMELFLGKEKIYDLQGELQNHRIRIKMNMAIKDIRQKMALVLEQDQIPDINGNVKLQVAVEGELPQADGEMDLKVKTTGELAKLSLVDKKLPTIKWKGRCRAQKQKVTIPQMELFLGKEKIYNLQGELQNRKLRIKMNMAINDIRQKMALVLEQDQILDINGDVKLQVAVEGELPPTDGEMDFDIRTRVEIAKLIAMNKKLPGIKFHGKYRVQKELLTIAQTTLYLGMEKIWALTGKVGLVPGGELQTQMTITLENLQDKIALFMPSSPISGNFRGEISISGNLPSSSGFAIENKSKMVLSDLHLHLPSAEGAGVGKDIKIHSLIFETNIVADQQNCKLDRLRLSWLPGKKQKALPIFNINGDIGYVSGKATDLTIEIPVAKLANRFFALWQIKDCRWRGRAPLVVKIAGQLPIGTDPMDMIIRLNWPWQNAANEKYWELELGELALWSQDSNQGAELFCRISGTTDAPQINVGGHFNQQTIRLGSEMKWKDLSIKWSVDKKQLLIWASIFMGGSPINCYGMIRHDNFLPREFYFTIRGKRLLLIRTEEIEGRADIDLAMKGKISQVGERTKMKARLAGVITIPLLKVKHRISLDLLNAKPQRAGQAIGYHNEDLDLDLDLRIKLQKIELDSNFARITTQGNISVKGTAKQPEIKGQIETTSGKLFLHQGAMNITFCSIRLREEDLFAPYIDITAETEVSGYKIMVKIKSPPFPALIEFSSSPSLPEEDILALLITGVKRDEFQEAAGQKGVEAVSNVALQQVLTMIGIGSHVSARATETSGSIVVDIGRGFAIEGEVDRDGRAQIKALYRIRFTSLQDLFGNN